MIYWTPDTPWSPALEAAQRAAFIAEAGTWLRTPFRDCADKNGAGVDCAMLLVRSAVDTKVLAPFDPRPYPPQWHLNQDEERFLGWIQDTLGGVEVTSPKAGDVAVVKFGRCYSHGAILVDDAGSIIHSHRTAGMCTRAHLREVILERVTPDKPRPVKYFDIWARRRRDGSATAGPGGRAP